MGERSVKEDQGKGEEERKKQDATGRGRRRRLSRVRSLTALPEPASTQTTHAGLQERKI